MEITINMTPINLFNVGTSCNSIKLNINVNIVFENKEKVNELKQFIYDSCSQIDNLPCPINVSIGYASAICHDNQELEQLMNQSDSSMYEEKSHNRNKMLS